MYFLNNLQYELHKLHFLNFSELRCCACMVRTFSLHEPIVGCIWERGSWFRQENCFGNSCNHTYFIWDLFLELELRYHKRKYILAYTFTHKHIYIHAPWVSLTSHPLTLLPTWPRYRSSSRSRYLFNKMHITSGTVKGSIFVMYIYLLLTWSYLILSIFDIFDKRFKLIKANVFSFFSHEEDITFEY